MSHVGFPAPRVLVLAAVPPKLRCLYADPVNFPLLIVGYGIIAAAMAALYTQLRPTQNWLAQSIGVGALIGLATFLGTHTVISGYTAIDLSYLASWIAWDQLWAW